MNIKISTRRVTFRSPFLLPGMDEAHAPGEFEIQIVEEPLDVMWEGYHRTLTIMLTSGAFTEAIAVSEATLEEALAIDSQDKFKTAPST